MHDAERVYVCIILGDEDRQRQLLYGGWTVWLDPTGGTTKTRGVRYPLRPGGPRPQGLPGEG